VPEKAEPQGPPLEADRQARKPGVRVAILGPLEIATTWPRDRALRSLTQQLVVYLVLHRGGATADELADALLPALGADRARKRIWRALSEARSELGDVILRSGDAYGLDRAAVAIDADEFDFLVAQAKAERGPTTRERLLERALVLLRGQPLAGTDYPWAAGDTRHLCAQVVDVLQEVGELRLAEGNPTEALAAAERAITFDAENESAQRLAMRAEAELGLRDAVVRRYEGLGKRLSRQFGLEPEQETRLLYRWLLSQDAGASASRPARRRVVADLQT
jgi:DNA-binding SARP family transcriptional activator